jgi:peroxiredoxin
MTKARAPDVGDVAPDFTAFDTHGTPCTLASLCADSPLVLVFYRGHW